MSFDNKNLTYDYLFPAIDTSLETFDFTVGAGIEVNPTTTDMTIDLSGGSIDIAFTNNVSFSDVGSYNGIAISDLTDNLARIARVSVTSDNGKVTQSLLSFTQDSASINLEGLLFLVGQHVVLNLTFGFFGTEKADILAGESANDILRGFEGRDELNGLGGNDILRGGMDHDILHGGKGADRLWGGRGADQLFGEGGSDIFVYKTDMRRDTIMDFNGKADRIDISGWKEIDSYETLLSHTKTVDGDAEISVGRDVLVIEGLTKAQLDPDFFGFVN